MAIKRSAKLKSKAEPAKSGKSYKDLIVEALISLGEKKGSSRPAVKKYIREKHPNVGGAGGFDSYFNNAIKKGVELKEFELPKGPSGTLKLVKKTESSKPSKVSKSEVSKNIPKSNEKNHGKAKTKPLPSPTYKEMIISGIQQLNNGKGSSRSALKKFVKDQYKKEIKASSNFDHLFNSALKKGIESGDLHQPKGPSGVVKVLKKKKSNALIKIA